ncbi:MAG: PIN domain-containing protein [Solirubrobacteraceae bacterium]
MTRVLLDTSVLIADDAPPGTVAAISVMSIAELHFGLLVATTNGQRAVRANRLAAIEATFEPLPVDRAVARAHGALSALVRRAGRQPRSRSVDLLIAATAQVHHAVLLTHNLDDYRHVDEHVVVRRPRE